MHVLDFRLLVLECGRDLNWTQALSYVGINICLVEIAAFQYWGKGTDQSGNYSAVLFKRLKSASAFKYNSI